MAPSSTRGKGFSLAEMTTLVNCAAELLPISGLDWEQLSALHEEEWPDAGRTAESLRRKFNLIIKNAPPTGDPNILDYQRTALLAYRQIVESTMASDGEESSVDEAEDIAPSRGRSSGDS